MSLVCHHCISMFDQRCARPPGHREAVGRTFRGYRSSGMQPIRVAGRQHDGARPAREVLASHTVEAKDAARYCHPISQDSGRDGLFKPEECRHWMICLRRRSMNGTPGIALNVRRDALDLVPGLVTTLPLSSRLK